MEERPPIMCIDKSNFNEDLFDTFFEAFKQSEKDLCIFDQEQILDTSTYIHDMTPQLIKDDNTEVYYIQTDETISAFAVVSKKNLNLNQSNILQINIDCLCSNSSNSLFKRRNYGKHIFNYIFDKYDKRLSENSAIIRIRPARKALTSLYFKWKQPNFPRTIDEDTFQSSHHLIYGNKEAYFQTLMTPGVFPLLSRYINIDGLLEASEKTFESTKESLISELKTNSDINDERTKQQLIGAIGFLRYDLIRIERLDAKPYKVSRYPNGYEGPSYLGGKPKRKMLDKCTVPELKAKAKERKITGYTTMKKAELIATLRRKK
jgi:hypothetical protein